MSEKSTPIFRKPTLDEMTVGRTEQPATPDGWSPPRQSYGEEMREKITHSKSHVDPRDKRGEAQDLGPLKRNKIGAGSYEDAGDERRRKRRPGKTGRPGR